MIGQVLLLVAKLPVVLCAWCVRGRDKTKLLPQSAIPLGWCPSNIESAAKATPKGHKNKTKTKTTTSRKPPKRCWPPLCVSNHVWSYWWDARSKKGKEKEQMDKWTHAYEDDVLPFSTTMSSHGLSTDARPRPCFRQPIAAWIRSNPGVGPAVQLPKCLFSEGGGSTGRSPSGDALDFPPRLSS